MIFTAEKKGNAILIKLAGRMDAITSTDFEEQCNELIEAGEKFMVLDLSELEYISSAGLRGILITAKKLMLAKGEISFAHLQGLVKDVISMSGFGLQFPIHETTEEALAKYL